MLLVYKSKRSHAFEMPASSTTSSPVIVPLHDVIQPRISRSASKHSSSTPQQTAQRFRNDFRNEVQVGWKGLLLRRQQRLRKIFHHTQNQQKNHDNLTSQPSTSPSPTPKPTPSSASPPQRKPASKCSAPGASTTKTPLTTQPAYPSTAAKALGPRKLSSKGGRAASRRSTSQVSTKSSTRRRKSASSWLSR